MVEEIAVSPPPGDCILFATADWDEPYWTNKQHTANELTKLGWRVLYVESVGLRAPALRSGRDWSRIWRRLRKGLRSQFFGPSRRKPNLWVLSPLVIPSAHRWPLLSRLNRWILSAAIQRVCNAKGFTKPVIWTYHPFIEAATELQHGPILYHCVDDLSAMPGIDPGTFRSSEKTLIENCDVIFGTARHLTEQASHIHSNVYFLPNVVDDTHFGRAMDDGPIPPEVAEIPEPRLVYHGVLSDFKVDFTLLLETATMRPDWHWILLGEEREGQRNEQLARLSLLPNVHLLGYRPYGVLPDYLRAMSVGLLPSLLNQYTKSMFPMKYFEYIASGLPVAATPLDFTNEYSEGVALGANAETFIQAIERQLCRSRLTREEAKKIVGENTWQQRTIKMIRALEEVR